MSTELDVTLSTPGDWIVVRHGDLADERAVDELVGDRLDAVPELAPYRDQLVTSITRTFARAEREGVVFTALYANPGRDGTPVVANLVVAASPAPPPELVESAAELPRLADVEQALDAGPDEGGVSQRAVHSLLLPGGPALRVARLSELALVDGGPRLTVLSVEYFFTQLAQVFVLRFVSPSLAAHQELQATFHEIAGTFRASARPAPAPAAHP